jgi:hypothetical protein
MEKRKPHPRQRRRSRGLKFVIANVEKSLRDAGYQPHAMVPLSTQISVVCDKNNNRFNVRVSKKTLEVEHIERLSYLYTKNRKKIKAITRTNVK